MTVSIYQDFFCVYITIVTDVTLKLPTFYIGSSSVEKVNSGYHGSVSSKTFKKLWKSELKANPNNFKTFILSYHSTDKEARTAERNLQKEHNAVKSPAFVNKALASVNGFFGMDTKGENNPMFGVTGKDNPASREEVRQKISVSHLARSDLHWSKTEDGRKRLSEIKTGKPGPMLGRTGENHPGFGTKRKRVICEYCKQDVAVNTYARSHGEKCKCNPNRIA